MTNASFILLIVLLDLIDIVSVLSTTHITFLSLKSSIQKDITQSDISANHLGDLVYINTKQYQ
jgi:hypothetical protein